MGHASDPGHCCGMPITTLLVYAGVWLIQASPRWLKCCKSWAARYFPWLLLSFTKNTIFATSRSFTPGPAMRMDPTAIANLLVYAGVWPIQAELPATFLDFFLPPNNTPSLQHFAHLPLARHANESAATANLLVYAGI